MPFQEREGHIQQEYAISWLHAKLEQHSQLRLNDLAVIWMQVWKCLIVYLRYVLRHIMSGRHTQNTFAFARRQLKYTQGHRNNTENHTAIIIISCAETDRKMHVVIQRVKRVFG